MKIYRCDYPSIHLLLFLLRDDGGLHCPLDRKRLPDNNAVDRADFFTFLNSSYTLYSPLISLHSLNFMWLIQP